ncbi:MAG: hypothetical protein HYX35_05030 [Proteobacteria bacterium]|nr:hypothetical protein [Pseudomonadota bacterium]
MSTSSLQTQSYDLAKGMEFVALWIMIVFCLVLFFSFRAQYRLMNTYDALNSFNPTREKRIQVMLAHIKRVIFSVLGYQGEERERQSLDQLNAKWMLENIGKISIRFFVFYFIYIWALILTTRALLIDQDTGHVQIISYTSKQIFGFLMIGIYIVTNSACDMLSIYVTIRNLEKIKQNPRLAVATMYLVNNLVYSFFFFMLSQLVSNLIWPLKTNMDIPLADRFFSPAIALWPYAFVLDASSSSPEYVHPIFPGQLLITGTVFLPTLVIVLLFIVLSLSILAVQYLKRFLIMHDLALLGVNVTLPPGQEPVIQFRCINALTVGITSSLIATVIFEWLRLIRSSV